MRASRSPGLVLPALLVLGLGCQSTFPSGFQSAFDLERIRGLLRSRSGPEAPQVGQREVALPAPQQLRATAGELRRVPLRWDPILTGDVAGYVVERSPEPGAEFERIATTAGRFATAFVDRGSDLGRKHGADSGTGLGDGAIYAYRIRAFDGQGDVGAATSEPVQVRTAPTPASPEDLRAYSNLPLRVALSWTPVPDPTVAGYVLYRSPSAGGDYLEIARVEGPFATTFVDRGLGALRVLHYRVAALNAAGGEGEPTPPVRAVTKPEPLPPVGLRVEAQGLGWNRLAWEPNVEEDIEGYRLVRRRPGQDAGELVSRVAPDALGAVDTGVAAGERLEYRVFAFDRDGLESAASDPLVVDGSSYGLRASAGPEGVQLDWEPPAAGELLATRVIRRGRLRDQELARVEGAAYFDQAVAPGRRYRYLLIGIRSDGSEAPPSLELEVQMPPLGAGVATAP